jgi:large subunit ribosomal protein L9
MAAKLILRADVADLGRKGDVVEVSDGFARNFLIPRALAITASPGALAQAEAMRRARDIRDARDREAAEQAARGLVANVIRIPARAGAGGRLFGSVTAADVAGAVEAQTGIVIDRRRMTVEPIKSLGPHEVHVKLHRDVEFRFVVEVVTTDR